jgi:hypothetical protein
LQSLLANESSIQVKGDQREDALNGKVVMTIEKIRNKKKKFNHGNLICQSLGLLLLAGIAPASVRAQNAARVVAPQAHPWATNATAKTETKVSGTIQQITAQHGASRFVIDGANGAVTADLGPAAGSAAKSFSAGDHIEIAGWMRSSNGKNVLIARQITAGDHHVVVRNEHGILVHPAPATSTKPQRVGASFVGGAR